VQSTVEIILEAAIKLPESERRAVVSRLLATLPPDDLCLSVNDPSLLEELDRRFEAHEGSVSWSELRTEKQR
jgi:hypothetical protein